ncbi:MAG: hypothetical protein OXG09_00010 [Chloroflexi bacterium]|nr:hypothetical protein [Chloroflexota bacterium]MCY3958696.1 hypothetical protein [Chloroflexota bacterium]
MVRELTLFDDIERTDHRPSTRARPSFDFLNTSAWPACHNMRDTLEQWFERYPDSSKSDLRARFRKRDHNHGSAFFELFLHEVFRRLGLSPEVHPESQCGRGRPDFATTSGSGGISYVEANVVGLKGFMAEDPLEDEVLDAIDALAVERPTGIALHARTRGNLAQSPPIRRIKAKVQRWVDRIDGKFRSPGSIEAEPSLEISHGSWVLTLAAIHRFEHDSKRLIHSGPGKGGPSSEGVALRKNVLAKAKQHRDLNRPLIIAMNTQSGFQDREDELSALFGQKLVSWQEDEHGNVVTLPHVSREPDAVWCNRAGSRYRRLHGVLFFRGAWPWTAHSVTSHLYVNPYIQADVPRELLRLGSARVRNGEIRWEAGLPLGDLLDLPEDWPGERTPIFSAH